MPEDKNGTNILYDLIVVGAVARSGRFHLCFALQTESSGHRQRDRRAGGRSFGNRELGGEISITGQTLMEKFEHHAKHLGGKIIKDDVSKIDRTADGFEVSAGGEKYLTKSIILALGMKPRKANIPGEDKFIGKGISYCATCDAMFFRGKNVVVIGGGDAAATAAIHLTEFANKVTLLYLSGGKIFEPSWDEQMEKSGKVDQIECTKITGVLGDQKVSGLTYESNGEKRELVVEGVFIEVGTTPGVTLAQGLGVALDSQSYIIVDATQATNVDNVFAAGDVTTGSNKFRQIITAVAEGAVAAGSLYRKLKLGKK